MTTVNAYLNFNGNCEEAFNFYKTVFGGEFCGGGVAHFGDFPPPEGMPQLADSDKNLIFHIELPIIGGHLLMGSDAPETRGFSINAGNNILINLEPDTSDETRRLYNALSAGGKVTMELQEMFWGALYGVCIDKYGIQWMFNCPEKLQ